MTPETAATLLFRMLGVVLLLGSLSFFVIPLSYLFLLDVNALPDAYFVAGSSIIWGGLSGAGGFAAILFSGALGRLLAKGLR